MNNALDQTRMQSRGTLEAVEKLTEEEVIEYHSNNECQSYGEAIIMKILENRQPQKRETNGEQSRAS